MQKNDNLVKAVNKNVRSSPRKISLVLDHIRGKKVGLILSGGNVDLTNLPWMSRNFNLRKHRF